MDETVGYIAPPGQDELVAALRAGDEATFAALVDELGPSMLRVAMMFVPTRAVAEDVVQETWLGVLAGIGRFEGRSSLKTWIFRILTNRAKTRGERESRSVPFSALAAADADGDEPAVDPDRFVADGALALGAGFVVVTAGEQARRQGDARGRRRRRSTRCPRCSGR